MTDSLATVQLKDAIARLIIDLIQTQVGQGVPMPQAKASVKTWLSEIAVVLTQTDEEMNHDHHP